MIFVLFICNRGSRSRVLGVIGLKKNGLTVEVMGKRLSRFSDGIFELACRAQHEKKSPKLENRDVTSSTKLVFYQITDKMVKQTRLSSVARASMFK